MTIGLCVLFGAVIGMALGLIGAGGSILAIPALVYGVSLSLEQAVPTSLLVVAASAAIGVLPRLRRQEVRWPVAGVLSAAGVIAAVGGATLTQLVPDPRAAGRLRGVDGRGWGC